MTDYTAIFSQRLNYIMTIRSMKPVELAQKTNISKSSISSYLAGQYRPQSKKIYLLAEALEVNPAWLMGISNNMTIEENQTDSNVFPSLEQAISVPIIGSVSAGLPILAVENIIGNAFAPSSYLKRGYTYFYLTVEGDSMNRKFDNGDIILVQEQDTLENDEIGVILIDKEDATVKKFKREDDIVILEPMSTNPNHQIQIYDLKKHDIKIIGKVISYQGRV